MKKFICKPAVEGEMGARFVWGVWLIASSCEEKELDEHLANGWYISPEDFGSKPKKAKKTKKPVETVEEPIEIEEELIEVDFDDLSIDELRKLAPDYGIDPTIHHAKLKKAMREAMLGS